VRFLAEAGIDQFLDVGAGIPTAPNVHQIAQAVIPTARVVYVDNDPIVLAHSRALLASSPQGRTAYLDADLRRPEAILADPVLSETLDLSRPVALSLIAILHFFPDSSGPAAIVRRLIDELPPGSHLVISQGTGDFAPEQTRLVAETYQQRGMSVRFRSLAEVEALVPPGMEILEPGVVLLHRWRPDTDPEQYPDADVSGYGLIARKR
jgi:hypothetical protein